MDASAPNVLTGDAAFLYMSVMLDAANTGRPIDARAVARDALLARRSNRHAIGRLRLAHASVTNRFVTSAPPRPCLARTAPRRPRFHVVCRTGRSPALSDVPRPAGYSR